MTTEKKIVLIDEACDHSVTITHYSTGWEIHSFHDKTPLDMERHYPYFQADTLKKAVDLAYDYLFKFHKGGIV